MENGIIDPSVCPISYTFIDCRRQVEMGPYVDIIF